MRQSKIAALALVALASVWASLAAAPQDPPQVKIPESGVPQVMTMEGKFVRAAYNNEGYVILGYQLANSLVGEEWMLLEFGMTVRDGVPELHVDPQRALTRHARRQEPAPADDHGTPRGQYRRPGEPRQGPAGLDQLLPAEREPACRVGFFPT